MKILTVNFLACAVKACKTYPLSFPLHLEDAELEQSDMEYNASFLRNILPRVDWEAFKMTAREVCVLYNPLVEFAFSLYLNICKTPCTPSLTPRLYSLSQTEDSLHYYS